MISPKVTTLCGINSTCGIRLQPDFCDRAADTFATTLRAFVMIASKRPSSIAFVSTNADPMPTATAPARIQSPALSSVTPPVGISFTCGNGARTSLMYCGPSMVAGKTFTMSAPASCAARISVGEKQPGMAGTPRSWQRSEEHTSELQSPYDLVCRLLLEKKKK